MKIQGNIRKYKEIYGNIRKYKEIHPLSYMRKYSLSYTSISDDEEPSKVDENTRKYKEIFPVSYNMRYCQSDALCRCDGNTDDNIQYECAS